MQSLTPEFERVCSAIGVIVITWAVAENELTQLNGHLSRYFGPIPGYTKAPASLKDKIACLRKAISAIGFSQAIKERGSLLADKFGDLGLRRHKLIHGGFVNEVEGGYDCVSIAYVSGKYNVSNHHVNIAQTALLGSEIVALAQDTTRFRADIASIIESMRFV